MYLDKILESIFFISNLILKMGIVEINKVLNRNSNNMFKSIFAPGGNIPNI
jgi:hypothetical protein